MIFVIIKLNSSNWTSMMWCDSILCIEIKLDFYFHLEQKNCSFLELLTNPIYWSEMHDKSLSVHFLRHYYDRRFMLHIYDFFFLLWILLLNSNPHENTKYFMYFFLTNNTKKCKECSINFFFNSYHTFTRR